MGTTISVKKLESALAKAQSVGIVEDTFSIGDCEVTIRNLLPAEYQAVVAETQDLDETTFMDKWQEGHVCRAIKGLNGVSFEGVSFVECEEEDPKKVGSTKKVNRELHDYLRRYVLSTWGKEALYVAYWKFSELVAVAEEKCKQGVTFLTPDETSEERFRRLLGDLKELETELPPTLLQQILEENGWTRHTAPQDREALGKLDEIANKSAPSPEPSPSPTQAAPLSEPVRRRTPLNQEPVDLPPPPITPPAVAPVSAPPAPRPAPINMAEVAAAPDPVPMMPPALIQQVGPRTRSSDFLAQELQYDPELLNQLGPQGMFPPKPAKEDIPVLTKSKPEDAGEFAKHIETRPVAGINPKFRPPPR